MAKQIGENKIAFFDFDGTITTKDTLIEFIKFAKGRLKFINGFMLLSPILILYKLNIIPNYKAKEKVLTWFFAGMNINDFEWLAINYANSRMDTIVRIDALERIKWHQQQGHQVVIVSASIEQWLLPWARKHRVKLIATKLATKNKVITGKLASKNCYGSEKVRRIKALFDLSKFDYIYAYGDSAGDDEMLAIANEGFYKPFR